MKKLLAILTLFCATTRQTKAQPYDQFNVIRVLSYAPRNAQCYNPTPGIGHYNCIEIPMGVLIRQQNGTEASVCCTNYKLDGALVDNIKKDFGKYATDGFNKLKSAIGEIKPGSLENVDPSIQQKLKALADLLNNYKNNIDVEHKPGDLLNYAATLALYDLTEAFIRSDASVSEKSNFIETSQKTSATLFEISAKGIANVSTTLIPFVNDARDLYELVNGRDLITGEEIDGFGRVVTGVALIAGNGNIFRKAVDKLKDSFFKKVVTESVAGIPGLKYTGSGSWASDAGLVYRKALKNADGSVRYENNLRHVLRHATPKPSDVNHTVFNLPPKQVPKLIDEAWSKRGAAVPSGGIDVFVVDMGKTVGVKGEKKIRIVLEKGTNNVITAYPQ